jgi:hypothetical protein
LRPETRHHIGRDLRSRGRLLLATLLRFRHQSLQYGGSRRSRFGTRREWRGEKRQHGETDLTLVGDA